MLSSMLKAIDSLLTKTQWEFLSKWMGEAFYIVIGLVFAAVAIRVLNNNTGWQKYTTALFWFLLAIAFTVGPYIPKWITGAIVVLISVLTAVKGIKPTKHATPEATETRSHANKIGNKVFIPSLVLALSAFAFATLMPRLGGINSIGLSSLVGVVSLFIVTKVRPRQLVTDGVRLMDNIGSVSILPQLLAALGALFTVAGVGKVISEGVSTVIPEGSRIIAVAAYCLGMALFTIIMGNAFAAFSVITVGIGIPFLVMQGANPAVVGALGMTAGYCGTLCTPMAANFNIMPAALLETKSKFSIIKAQVPFALVMLFVHIVLMTVLAF